MIEKLINLERLVFLLTLPSLAVAAYPCVCGCAWVVRPSVCVCCVPGSVSPSAFASAVSVLVPGSLVLPSVSAVNLAFACCRCLSLYLWLCLGCPLLYLCLLYAWVRSSVYVCICCICPCAWFGGSFVCVCCLYLCLGCLLIFFHFFIVSLNQSINQGHLRQVKS